LRSLGVAIPKIPSREGFVENRRTPSQARGPRPVINRAIANEFSRARPFFVGREQSVFQI
jgi:hypothetical protein